MENFTSDFDKMFQEATGKPLFDAKKAIRESRIDTSKVIENQPMLLSYGRDWSGDPICVLGEGDISVITGKSKSKKTFFKSMLISSYIAGDESDTLRPFTTHRKEDKIILDIDTEQSYFHAWRAARRIKYMVGADYSNYKPMALRRYSASERMAIVAEAVETYKDQIGLLMIDGYIDLVEDFNDQIGAREMVETLMKWTEDYGMHICGVLHQNPGSEKMIGHVGSAVIRKVSTAIEVKRDDEQPNASWIYHPLARDIEFDPFQIEIIQGLPHKTDKIF